jgi:integrase/recombinase XerD
MADDLSRARGAWAGPIDALLSFLGLERGLSANTLAAYRRDLDQAAAFLARRGAADWGAVTGDHAAAWLQFLAAANTCKSKSFRISEPYAIHESCYASTAQ